jgi:ribosomal protein S27E
VLFHYFETFVSEYEQRFEKEYGFPHLIVKEVVEKYLDCGNPRCGFARIRCPDCKTEYLLTFSCKTRGFCPSCNEQVGKYMIRPLLSLERLSFLENEGKVCYRYGQHGASRETMDYLEFIARVTSSSKGDA